jgi:hypothetical protein
LRTVRAAQPEATEPEDALEMSKQHLDAFSVATGLFEGICSGERTRNVASIFMNVARDLAGRLLGTASHLVRTRVAIRFARPIQDLIIIYDLAGRGESFECWTDVDIARLIVGTAHVLFQVEALKALRN